MLLETKRSVGKQIRAHMVLGPVARARAPQVVIETNLAGGIGDLGTLALAVFPPSKAAGMPGAGFEPFDRPLPLPRSDDDQPND